MKKEKIQEFKKYENRVNLENTINALFLNMIIAASLMIVTCLIVFFVDSKLFYVPVIVFFTVLIVGMFIAVLVRRATNLDVARRIDSLGLNQQITTMLEFINDDSDIAKIQRERAKKLLSEINQKDIKIFVNKKYWIIALVIGIVAIVATSLVGISNFNGIPQYHNIQKNRMTKKIEKRLFMKRKRAAE